MSIRSYYKQSFEIFEEVKTNVSGVIKDTKVSKGTFKGVIDKAPTQNLYTSDKDTFIYTNTLFTAINSEIVEGRIITCNGNDYDIVGQIDPLGRGHHLEVQLNRRA